jgi:hypothetical protein
MEKEFNEQESLKLIADMITQARERFQKRNGHSILLWGYSIAILALANFVLLLALEGGAKVYSYYVWCATVPLFVVNYMNEARKAGKTQVRNYVDNLIGYVWLAFFISCVVIITSVFAFAGMFEAYHGKVVFLLINPLIMGITGLCLFINGKAYRFPPFAYGAVAFWAGSLLSVAVLAASTEPGLQFLLLTLCVLVGFILPGHRLNRKVKQDV